MINNLTKCGKCGYALISEENNTHECKDVQNYKIDHNVLWLSDGEKWYPQRLLSHPKTKHPFKTPRESTKPKLII